MPIEIVKAEREWIIELRGVVDIFDAATLYTTAVAAADGASWVFARLDGAEALDTSATQVLLALRQALAADGRTLRVTGTPPAVAEVWRLGGLDGQLG